MNRVDSDTGPAPAANRARLIIAAVALAGPVLFGGLSLYMGQDANWDLKNYHYYNAYAFLEGRLHVDFAPAQIQSFVNPILDVPFYWLLRHLSPRVYGFLVGALHGLNFSLVLLIAAQLVADISGPLLIISLALAGAWGAGFIGQLGTVHHDDTVALFFLASLLTIIRSYRVQTKNDWKSFATIAAAGMILGLGVGLKYTMAPYAIGIGAALLLMSKERSWSWRRLLQPLYYAGGVAAGTLATAGYWMTLLWTQFGNPIFPQFNNIFRSPLAPAVAFADTRFRPAGFVESVFYPFIFAFHPQRISEIPFRDFRFAALAIALVASVCARAVRTSGAHTADLALTDRTIGVFFVIITVVAYVCWMAAFSIYRYLIPLELIAPLTLFALFDRLPLPVGSRRILIWVVMGFLVAAMRPQAEARQAWDDRFLGVQAPAIADPSHTLVLMAGTSPLSYVIPAFDPRVRFVRVEANWMLYPDGSAATDRSPLAYSARWPIGDDGPSLIQLLRKAIAEYDGRALVLFDSDEREHVATVMAAFGDRMHLAGCQPVRSKLDADKLQLCPLERQHEP